MNQKEKFIHHSVLEINYQQIYCIYKKKVHKEYI